MLVALSNKMKCLFSVVLEWSSPHRREVSSLYFKDLIKSFSNYEIQCLVESILRYVKANNGETTELNNLLALLENELQSRNLKDKE